MKPKIYIIIFLSAVIAFVIIHLLIWNFLTKDILSGEMGDLSRTGYLPEMTARRDASINLLLRHVEARNFNGGKIDVLTIGDSFSQGAGGSKNSYYQDYIASLNDYSVLNLPTYHEYDFITTMALLHNSGYLAKIHPRHVIIERIERGSVHSFDKTIDFNKSSSLRDIENHMKASKAWLTSAPEIGFINTGNIKYFIYRLLYNFSENAFFGRVHALKLDRPLFTVGRGETLLVTDEEIKLIPFDTEDAVKGLNDNLNRLADMLEKDGIQLHFMPVVDKYNLYRPYIINNRHPASAFFELLRPLPKRYDLIDTKAILSKELERGEKDVFMPDDTHWSWKASKKIFENVKFD